MWKRRKNLLYIGSVHGGELPEFFGLTGDYLGTDAIGMRASLPSFPVTSLTYGDHASQFHQPLQPQLPQWFHGPEPVIERHLASIHPGQQEDASVQRQHH